MWKRRTDEHFQSITDLAFSECENPNRGLYFRELGENTDFPEFPVSDLGRRIEGCKAA